MIVRTIGIFIMCVCWIPFWVSILVVQTILLENTRLLAEIRLTIFMVTVEQDLEAKQELIDQGEATLDIVEANLAKIPRIYWIGAISSIGIGIFGVTLIILGREKAPQTSHSLI